MKHVFWFELKRIFQLKHIFMLLLFFGLALYVVYFGSVKYRDFTREKENFLNYERLKAAQYVNYEQYGFHGFRVLLQPSPLVVFSHSYLTTLKSNIDIKDIVNITSNYKGQKIFTYYGRVGDFSTIFFVLGSLLMVFFGLNTFAGTAALRFNNSLKYIFGTLCTRVIVLIGTFLIVIFAVYFFTRALGISFSGRDTVVFCGYSLYILIFISVFYFLGIVTAVIWKFKKTFFISAYLVWFIIIFVIPLIYNMDMEKRAKQIKSNEMVNLEKLNNGKDFERKAEAYFEGLQEKKVKDIRRIARQFIDEYIQRIIPLNKSIETDSNREVKQLINHHEQKALLTPPSFYCFLSKEFSSMGYYGYQEFLANILELKDRFYQYYFDKRYNQIHQAVEPFVKDNENIFQAKSLLPLNYWQGLAVTLFYSLLLLAGALLGLRRIMKPSQPNPRVKLDIDQLEIGKTYFYFARNVDPGQKKSMFSCLESQQAVIIEKPGPGLFEPGLLLDSWVRFEARQKGLDADVLGEYLEILNITPQQLQQPIKNPDDEVLYAAYLGIQLARNAPIYVFDDFLNRVSREFEQTCKEAIDKLLPHAVIIYWGNQMFDITLKEENRMEECRFVAVDLNDVTLR